MISEFAKEKVFWTRKMNLKLVKFIENKPNIWNPKHPKYTSVEYRDQTYAEFASKYGNEFTGQAVKDRWTNIRSTFANYLRKVKANQSKEGGEIYKVNWHLWDACRFLLTINKKNKIMPKSIEYTEDDMREDVTIETEEFSSEEDKSVPKISKEFDTTCQDIGNGILNVFRGVQNDIFNVDNSKFGKLGRTLANKLSQLSSFEATQVCSKVMEILLLYHKDNPVNPNNLKCEDL